MFKIVKQKFSNDCAIASVAMALRIPYARVLQIAKLQKQFKPNGRFGCYVGDLIEDLGRECDYHFRHHGQRFGLKYTNFPVIVTINSVNNRHGKHAVVVYQGRVCDPTNKRQATLQHVRRTALVTYVPK